MKKPFLITGFIVTLTINPLFSDVLSNSLNNMLKKKDSSGMVNLSGINVGGKRKPKVRYGNQIVRKTRPSTTVIGHYNNGKAIIKKEANAYLKKVTKGKIKDLDLLPKKQRLLVLKDLQKMYEIKHFKKRPGTTVIGHYNDDKPVLKKEANAYLRKVTKGKIKDLDFLPKKQRLIVLKDLQKMYAMKHIKSRPSTAVVATVNEKPIFKSEADNYLTSVTGGNIKDFDRLDSQQRLRLIQDISKPIVIKEAAENNVTSEEKEEIFKQMWIGKKRKMLNVSSEEMLALYNLKKQKALAVNPQAVIPNYMSLGDSLKNEILEQKIMGNLMKDVNITVNYDANKTVVIHDLNHSSVKLDKMTKTKE